MAVTESPRTDSLPDWDTEIASEQPGDVVCGKVLALDAFSKAIEERMSLTVLIRLPYHLTLIERL